MLIENREINKKYFRILNQLTYFDILEIDYSKKKKIKSNQNLILAYLSFFILKSFIELLPIYNHEIDRLNGHSDDLINNIISYFEKIIIWIEVKKNIKYNLNRKDIRYIIIVALALLSKNKKIKKTNIFKKKKTYTFYFEKDIKWSNNINFISNIPYETYPRNEKSIYLFSWHYSSIENIYRENIYSQYTLDLGTEEKEILKKITSYWIYIDKSFLKKSIYFYLIKINIKEEEIIELYKNNLKLLKLFLEKNDLKAYTEVSRKISDMQIAINLINIINDEFIKENQKIYLPFMFDFRGRLYYTSLLSPTFNKFIRNCLHWGEYKKYEENFHIFNELVHKQLDNKFYILESYRKYDFCKIKNITIKRALVWLFVSVAEIEKTKLGSAVKLEDFIKKGIETLNNFDDSFIQTMPIDDFLKIKYLENIINEITNGIFIKRLISKDATASVYQHLIKSLGWKNEETLKWCNLSSTDTWYDIYQYIIKSFKKTINLENITNEEFYEIYTRKNLKKTIMTKNYGASFQRCLSDFLSMIPEKYLKNENKKESIINSFKIFYAYMMEEEDFFNNNPKEIYNFFEKNNYIMKVNNTTINLNYQETKTNQIEFQINGERYTKKELELSTNVNIRKVKSSIKANYVHSLDSALVRWFLLQNKGITIHDCFMIDYLNTTYLISKINEGMRITFHDLGFEKKIINDNLFSIFILL